MLRRFLLRFLVLAGILLACFAHLVWNGWHAKKIVAENLPHPALSTGKREIDLWHPTASPGHVYDFTWAWPEDKPWNVPEGSRLEVQLASGGRTRLLVVLPGHPSESPTWWDVLRRRHRLQIVGDRDWVDLGPLPAEGAKVEMQVYGLLPGPFAFAEPHAAGTGHFNAFLIRRPDSPRARPSRTIVRYRFRVADPVPAGETLARFFFFISCSRVLQVAGIAALVLLFTGWWWLWEGRFTRAVAALVPAVTLIHACCLPPFQGADEIAHEATAEALIWNPAMLKGPPVFPKSLARVHDAIGYDRFVGDPETPLPVDSPERRTAIASILENRLADEAAVPGTRTEDGRTLDPTRRASLYYYAFRPPGPLFRSLSVLDRLEAYVVVSAVASLLLFVAGLLFLSRSGAAPSLQLAYGLVALLPYSVGVVASCSNYSPAIGIGQFLAACLVAGVMADSARRRLLAAALFAVASLIGIGVWDDFVFFAVPSTVVLALLAAHAASRMPAGSSRKTAMAGLLLSAVTLAATTVFALATGRIRNAISSFGARLPKELGGFEDPSLWLLFAAAAAPLVVSLVLALAIVRAGGVSETGRERAARTRSAALTVLFLVMFVLTPWSAIPFEATRFDYPDEVAAHWSAFWSNNFAFDQDVLSWKMYWGVFGYADVSYPDALYALARWTCVGLFLALPVLSWRFTRRSPGRSALLLVASAWALSACVVTNSLRYFAPTNPWGRFILPAFALAALPLLARAVEPGREPTLRLVFAVLVALHVWTAIALLGSRYALGI
ncbi:MAG TPA: hypothetical protein VGM13_11215 [Thermoanaerobaculia bacterium]